MILELLPALILFSLAACLTPGPNTILLTLSGTHFGMVNTLPHILGIRFGMIVMHVGMLFGLAELFTVVPYLYTMLQIFSALYIAYLAFKVIKAQPKSAVSAPFKPMSFTQGMLFQLINPKSYAVLIILSTAMTLSDELYWYSALTGLVVFNLISSLGNLFWVVLGKQMRKYISDPNTFKWFNRVMALLLLATIPMIFFS